MKHLKYLDLSENNIKSLPKEIFELDSLITIKLNSNSIEKIPFLEFNNNALKQLELDQNNIYSIANSIRDKFQLNYLGLADNPITDKELGNLNLFFPNTEIFYENLERHSALRNLYLERGDFYNAFYELQYLANQENVDINDYKLLSFLALLTKHPKEAIEASKKVLALNPNDLQEQAYLSLGYLQDYEWNEAETILLKHKGVKFNQIFISLVKTLKNNGVEHPFFDEGIKILK